MVAYTLKELGRMERRFAKDSPGRSNPWMKDPTARAWLLETMNNRPAYAYAAAKGTLRRTSGQELSRQEFLAVLESEILGAYEARDERVKGEHIIAKIPRVVPSGGPAATRGRPEADSGLPRRRPAQEPNWSVRRPPSCHPAERRPAGRVSCRRSVRPVSSPPRCACSSRPGTATPTR